MRSKTYLLLLPLISIFIVSAYSEEVITDVSIPRAAVCTDIQSHEPVGNDINFPEDIEKLFFFTEIKSDFPGTIKHIWYYENTKLDETELEYGAGRYRTWSYHTINPNQKGEWQIEATTNDGTVIKRLIFTIGLPTEEGFEE